MSSRIVLDAGPLSELAHPKAEADCARWFASLLRADCIVFVPEIADYEVRRELLRAKKSRSVKRLDAFKTLADYLPIDTRTMLLAAEFWAGARQRGTPTADRHALDGDAILAAQATLARAIVATNNVGHLDQFVETMNWKDISPNPRGSS